MLVYNDYGDMHNEKAGEIAKVLSQITHQLYEKLFEEGMTMLEARALIDYLTCEIHTTAIMSMMRKRCELAEAKEETDA